MKHLFLCVIITGIFCFVRCNKDETCIDPVCQLPPITQEGKNTFACLIDGKPWTANTSDGFFVNLKPISAKFLTVNGVSYFGISTLRRNKMEGPESEISLYIANATDKGNYSINTDGLGLPGSSAHNSVGTFKVSDAYTYPYITDSINTGQVTITRFDIVNNIYSGTFYFTAKNKNDNTLIHITDGRFDIKLP